MTGKPKAPKRPPWRRSCENFVSSDGLTVT